MIRERLISQAFTEFTKEGAISLDTAAKLMEHGVIVEKLEANFRTSNCNTYES